MARHYHEIKGLAEFTAKTLVLSEEDWKKFLHMARHKDEHMYFGKVELDINPINTAETGPLAQYLPGVEKYLEEKAEKMEQNKIVAFSEKKEPKQVVTFTVAESSEFHSFGELHEGIPTLQDAIEVYEKLKHESALNGI